MIQTESLVDSADNSGAKELLCIKVLGGSRKRYATVGSRIICSVKKAKPDSNVKKGYINQAINTLNDREKTIIRLRKFKEKSITLDELGQMLKISKERVRQIETKALEKLKKAILDISQQNREFFI